MGIYYDNKVYGIKWDHIIEVPVYKHNTIFGRSQNKPLCVGCEIFEEIRAEFFKLSEEDKEKYRFYFYRCGQGTYDPGVDDVFYTWMPCSVFEIMEFLCKDTIGEIP